MMTLDEVSVALFGFKDKEMRALVCCIITTARRALENPRHAAAMEDFFLNGVEGSGLSEIDFDRLLRTVTSTLRQASDAVASATSTKSTGDDKTAAAIEREGDSPRLLDERMSEASTYSLARDKALDNIAAMAAAGDVPVECVMEINVAFFYDDQEKSLMNVLLLASYNAIRERIRTNNLLVLNRMDKNSQATYGAAIVRLEVPLFFPWGRLEWINERIIAQYGGGSSGVRCGGGRGSKSVFRRSEGGYNFWSQGYVTPEGAVRTDAGSIGEAMQKQHAEINRLKKALQAVEKKPGARGKPTRRIRGGGGDTED
jgi:hypothetical protein